MKMSEEYSVNKEDLDQALTDASIAVNEYNQNKLDAQVAGVEAKKEDTEILKTQEDPRNQEDWGFKGLLKEGQSIISGGLQDTASSLATFPERTIDAFSGEMKQQKLQTGFQQVPLGLTILFVRVREPVFLLERLSRLQD